MASQGREEMFFRIAVFFAIVTAITGICNLANAGTITLGSLGTSDGKIPGQMEAYSPITLNEGGYAEGADNATGAVITDLDFTTAAIVNQNVTKTIGGSWTLTAGTGEVLTSLPLLSGVLNPSAIILRNTRSTSGTYTVNAKVNNAGGGSFYVFPRYQGGNNGNDLKVVFASDGVHIKKFPLYLGVFDNGDDYFYPLPNSQDTIMGGSTITTVLEETVSATNVFNSPDYTAKLTVSKDGTALFTSGVRSILPGTYTNSQIYHGGAGSDTVGFIVMGFPTTNLLDTNNQIISGSGQAASVSIFDLAGRMFDSVVSAIGLLGIALGVAQDPLVPFWLWAIIGLPCLATDFLIYIEIARGV
jgi:hypothetical protein